MVFYIFEYTLVLLKTNRNTYFSTSARSYRKCSVPIPPGSVFLSGDKGRKSVLRRRGRLVGYCLKITTEKVTRVGLITERSLYMSGVSQSAGDLILLYVSTKEIYLSSQHDCIVFVGDNGELRLSFFLFWGQVFSFFKAKMRLVFL